MRQAWGADPWPPTLNPLPAHSCHTHTHTHKQPAQLAALVCPLSWANKTHNIHMAEWLHSTLSPLNPTPPHTTPLTHHWPVALHVWLSELRAAGSSVLFLPFLSYARHFRSCHFILINIRWAEFSGQAGTLDCIIPRPPYFRGIIFSGPHYTAFVAAFAIVIATVRISDVHIN